MNPLRSHERRLLIIEFICFCAGMTTVSIALNCQTSGFLSHPATFFIFLAGWLITLVIIELYLEWTFRR